MTEQKRLSKKELEAALASGQITYKDAKSKHRKGYEVRITSGHEVSDSYPGKQDHPSPEGSVYYEKTVDTSELATVWQAVTNEHYAQGGIPKWVRDSLSELDMSVYWQMAHYQMVWNGRANMSFKTLSRNLGVKYRSIQRSVHRLLDLGAVVLIQKHSGRKTAAYRVVLLSSLENNEFVEATSEFVEATSESSKDDQASTQKTKPLKGRVARSPAGAGRATPREKKSDQLATIDEARKIRAKSIAREEISAKPKLIRAFFPVEVKKETLNDILQIGLLAKKMLAIKKLDRQIFQLRLEDRALIPTDELDEEIVETTHQNHLQWMQAFLTSRKFDVSNLPKALDFTLDHLLKITEESKLEWESGLQEAKEQCQREDQRRQAQESEEAARKARAQSEYRNSYDYLTTARALLQAVLPNITDAIAGWGSATNLLIELRPGGKEARRIADPLVRPRVEEVSVDIEAHLKVIHRIRISEQGVFPPLTVNELTECWAAGGDEWLSMADIFK